MSYPLYPQIDPKEVQQAQQFNVTHQPSTQYNHTFINPPSATPAYQPQNFAQPQINVPQHNFIPSNPYAPNQSHQATQYYYYQPQQINTYPTNTQNNHQFVQQNPPQTSYPYLYQTQQHNHVPPVQTGIPSQTHPVTQAPSLHSTKSIEQHQPPQESSKNVPPPQHLSDEEQEDEELETASSVITTDRKLARMLTRIERTLKRLQISIMKRNRSGTTRSKEILEASIVEIQSYHITDAEERAAVNVLIQRIQLSLKHAEEELALMEQDRQRQLAQYRNAVMEIKKEAEQAQHLLEGSLDQQTQEIIQQVHQQQHQT